MGIHLAEVRILPGKHGDRDGVETNGNYSNILV